MQARFCLFSVIFYDFPLGMRMAYLKWRVLLRYCQKPAVPWSAIYTPTGVFVIVMLIGYIIFTAYNRYATVVEDCRKMEELKVQAEAADVAKSQASPEDDLRRRPARSSPLSV